jgi:hypothetical protein
MDVGVTRHGRATRSGGAPEEASQDATQLGAFVGRFVSPKKANKHIILYSER